MGADDYLTKPFEIVELLARVEAVLRRYKKAVNQLIYDKMNIKVASKSVREQPQAIAMEFPYGEHNVLQWQASVRITWDKTAPAVLSIGLKSVADLIPELQED